MNGEWCYLNNSFTSDECDEIVKLGLSQKLEEGMLGAQNSIVDYSYRKSKRAFINASRETDWIFKRFWEKSAIANTDYFQIEYNQLEFIQFTSYEEGEYYHSHADLFIYETPQRKLSVTVQLTDSSEYEGGELCFENLEEFPSDEAALAMREKGTSVYFPSFIRHSVSNVTKGTRYSLVAWFLGPDWK